MSLPAAGPPSHPAPRPDATGTSRQRAFAALARPAAALAVLATGLATGRSAAAQPPRPPDGVAPTAAAAPPSAAPATSVLLGGFAIAESRLALAKVEHARGRWAVVGDVTRDGVNERWSPGAAQVASRGTYVLWAASLTARRYTRPGARGFYAEAGGGAGRAALDVTPDGGATVARRATVPLASLGVGGRVGLGRTPAFVELGLRSAIPLATRHLHAGVTPPAGSTREPVSYQSWYLGRGQAASQMYVGVGLTR